MEKQENIWNEIPLTDYELHMSHETVGQLLLLNKLTGHYLKRLKPERAIFLGIAGGNGLENIDISISKKVVGIDINEEYLKETKRRYLDKIPSLEFLQLDITKEKSNLTEFDFVWAALIMEYTGIESVLKFAYKSLKPNAHLIVSIQSNNNNHSISETGIESIKKVGSLFQLVSPVQLEDAAIKQNFLILSFEENFLPNGKSIKTYLFQKK